MAREIKQVGETLDRLTTRQGPTTVIAYILLFAVLFGSYSQQERIIGALQSITLTQATISATMERMGQRLDAIERRP